MFKPHALDMTLEDWKTWCLGKKYQNYIAKQIFQWIFSKQLLDPKSFTNLSSPLREHLNEEFEWGLPAIDSHLLSIDKSEKCLLKTSDNLLFEMVLMPYEHPSALTQEACHRARITLCISSQVGCKMGCNFCQTGKLGFKRNLTSGEILSQIIIANRRLHEMGAKGKVTNIVFMGMGEPLDNYDNVVRACSIMIDPEGFALSYSRVTISTAGLIPEIRKLSKALPVRLAISLHSADEEKRSGMMPINKKFPLKELKEALLEYPAPKRYGITFEYVMIENVNDSLQDAKKLVHFLHGLKAKVNLIPINHFPGISMHPSKAEKIRQFQTYLSERSIPAPVRYSRGQDISGGCGQLAAKRKEELHLDPRELSRLRREEARKAR